MSRPYFHSSSFKMALFFAIMLGVSSVILAYFFYDFGRKGFLRETEAAIDAEIAVLQTLEIKDSKGIKEYIQARSAHADGLYVGYVDADGTWLAGKLEALPEEVQILKEGLLHFAMEKSGQRLAAKIYTFADGSKAMVARDVHNLIASYERLQGFSLLIIVLMFGVVSVSFGISYFVVSRINRIAVTAQAIVSTGDLSQRISIDTTWDDLSNLAQVLNDFLVQMESLMRGVREVSNHVAHDLRTPLTRLRNDLESLQQKTVTAEDLQGLLEESDRILGLFQALLRVTTIEKGARYQHFRAVDLSTVLRDVIELYEPVAEEKHLALHAEIAPTLQVYGDPDLLFQLFANVLDNAIKFSDSDSTVQVIAKQEHDQVHVVVKDEGPGIADDKKEQVFTYFYSGDSSRDIEGYGLGLSLVKAVLNRHGGSITLKDGHPGLEVWVAFSPYR